MAATVTKNDAQKVGGKWLFSWDIVETGSGGASNWAAITDVPVRGTIVKLHSVFVSGSGSTVRPVLGRTDDFVVGDINQITAQPTAAALVIDTTRTPYYSSTGTLYLESTPDNGTADHVVHTKLLIVASWE